MANAGSNQVVEQAIVAHQTAVMSDHLLPACRYPFAQQLLSTLNTDTGLPASTWMSLDDSSTRSALLQTRASAVFAECADRVAKSWADQLNVDLEAAKHYPKSPRQLARMIAPVLAGPAMAATVRSAFGAPPFPEVWPDLGAMIAAQLFAGLASGDKLREWQVFNRLLLSSFFLSCRLPSAQQVVKALRELEHSLISVRGSLVRLPERISKSGVDDVRPPLTPLAKPITLAHRGLSSLLAACHDESQAAAIFNGIAHRVLGVNQAVRPEHAAELRRLYPDRDPEELMRESRRVRFQQYNFTVLGYMALCATDQLLHARAQHLGLPHVGPNGWLVEIDDFLGDLNLSATLVDRIRRVYLTDHANIRNRIMHGGLLEIEGQRVQLVYRSLIGATGPDPEPYSSENVANICLQLLQDVDSEVAAAGLLSAADLAWVAGKSLSSADVAFVQTLADPRKGDTQLAEAWRRALFEYLTAFCPAANITAKLGIHGFFGYHGPNSFVQVFFLSMTFETLYRDTLHLLGHEVLQLRRTKAKTQWVSRYHVMDDRPDGLCTSDALAKVTARMTDQDRSEALSVFRLAVTVRDAFAHGAVPNLTAADLDATGHIFVRALTLLRQVAIDHLTHEAAYYRWINGGHQPGTALSDWRGAQQQIVEHIRAFSPE